MKLITLLAGLFVLYSVGFSYPQAKTTNAKAAKAFKHPNLVKYNKKSAAVAKDEVSLAEFQSIVKNKSAVIIDVNNEKTFAKGHVPGSFNYFQNEKTLAKLLPKDKNALIVAYCGGPLCTAWKFAAKRAGELGYKNVKHFKGGIKGWKAAKMAVETI